MARHIGPVTLILMAASASVSAPSTLLYAAQLMIFLIECSETKLSTAS